MRSAPRTPLRTASLCAAAVLCAAAGAIFSAPAGSSAAPWGASPALLRAVSVHGTRCVKHRSRRHPHARLCRHRRPGTKPDKPAGKPAIGVPPASGPSSSGGAPPTSGPSGQQPPPTETPSSEPPPSIPRVQVTAVEYGLALSRTTVPAGKVIFEFVDGGQDEHNLTAASEEGETAFAFATAFPKEVHDQKVELKRGSYLLFCSLPEHEAKGMKATLVVQ